MTESSPFVPGSLPPPEVADVAKDPKRRLGKYVLVNEIGRGGMAVVYKAWDELLQHFVALKLIRTQDVGLGGAPQEKDIQEFLREARMMVKLSHPHIVRLYEVGHHDDRYFLSMEYVEGQSLFEILRRERKTARGLPFYANPRRFLNVLREVALALEYAHRQKPPVVHRDIKPQNVLVGAEGRAVVVDFGLAKEMKAGPQLTISGITKGTPCYMSPEQASGRIADVGPQSDVYALGAVMYECLTGQPPFTAPTEREILNKIVTEEPVPPCEALRRRGSATEVLPDLERICLKALEKDRIRRYRSASDFAADIGRFLKGQSVRAEAVRGYTRAWRWATRKKSVVLPTAAAVVMGVIALVAILARGGSSAPAERTVGPKGNASSGAPSVEKLASEFRFKEAIVAAEASLSGENADRDLPRLEELRLQDLLLSGLVERIQKNPRDYPRFSLKTGALKDVRVLYATAERLFLRVGTRAEDCPWSRIEPSQFLALVRDYWPDIDGRAALGLGVWCLKHGLSGEAAVALKRPSGAEKTPPSDSKTPGGPTKEERLADLLGRGEAALKEHNVLAARYYFEHAQDLAKSDARVLKGLEQVAELEKSVKEEETKQAARPKAVSPSGEYLASLKKADERIRKDDFAGALAELSQAIAREPNVGEGYRRRGSVYSHLRDYTPAIADFTRSLELQPNTGNDHHHRGLCYYDSGSWVNARADLWKAVELGSWNTDYAALYVYLARARLGEDSAAARELKEYAAKSPREDAAGKWFLSIAFYLCGDSSQSELMAAVEQPGTKPTIEEKRCEACFYIGTKLLVRRNREAAADFLQKCVDTGISRFMEFGSATSELERLSGKGAIPAQPRAAAAVAPSAEIPARWKKTAGGWYYRTQRTTYNGAFNLRVRSDCLVGVGWVETDREYQWLQVGVPSGDRCRWLWVNQLGQEGESEWTLGEDGTMQGSWNRTGGASQGVEAARPAKVGLNTASEGARKAILELSGAAEGSVFRGESDAQAWIDRALRKLRNQ
jgi:lipoprotein NlpI/predicted Ser/Thr protein kinase